MLVDNESTYKNALERLSAYPRWTVDVETNGLDPYGVNQLCGVGIGIMDTDIEEIVTFYFPFRHQQGVNLEPSFLQDLMHVMSQREALLGYNLKFDLRFLENEGLDISNIKLLDGMVLVRLTADSTVKELGLAWFAPLPTRRGIEATPLMADGVLYVTASWGHVLAFDARSGEPLWHFDPKVPKDYGVRGCCGGEGPRWSGGYTQDNAAVDWR